MADNKLNLIVQFNAIDKMSGAMKSIIGLGRTGQQSLRLMFNEAKGLKKEMAGVAAAIAKGTGNVSALMDKEKALAAQLAKVNTQIERQKKLVAIDGTVSRVQARGAALQSQGRDNMLAGAGMLTPFVIASKSAMDFSSGMVDIQLKANLTNRETAAMAQNIIAAAEAAHRMPEDMRAGVDVLSGFGLDPRQAVQMIGPIGRLGTAFKVDIADGSAAAFANLSNLKVPIQQTSRALDVMAAAGNAGAFEVKDMARHFPGLTAQMQGLGQSGLGAVADLSAALQIARRAAGTSDEAGTNIQNLLAKINSPGTIRNFQKNFGVDLPAALKRAYAEGKTPMEALAEITQKATGGDLSKIGFAVEDMQAQAALRSLIQNMGDYRKIRADIAKGGGTVNKAFSTRELQDASVAWESFKGTASALAINLGTTLLPVLTEFLRNVNSVVGGMSRWAQANPQAAGTLVKIIAGLGVAKLAFGALQFIFGTIIGPMSTMWGWFTKVRAIGGFGAIAMRAAKAFGIVRIAVMFLARGVMQAGMMMLANPIVALVVAIVIAVAALAYAIYANWDKIKAAFSAGWQYLRSSWQGMQAWFSTMPGWFQSIGRNIIQGLVGGILGAPGVVFSALKNVVMAGVNGIRGLLGIQSPSRVFMAMGGHMAAGMEIGLDRGRKGPMRAAGRLAAGVAGAGAMAMAGPQLAAARGAGGAPAPVSITITIQQQPGEDAQMLARRVATELERQQRGRAMRSYADDFA